MWVIGFTLMIDGIDQYIVRGDSDQLKAAFHVGDTAIAVLFSAFILVNGIATLPSGYLADRWNRTKAMAVTIVCWSVISALGGLVPTSAFLLLVVIRGSLGFGQAITDPSGSSVIADFYGTEKRGKAFSIQQCLNYVGLGVGLVIGGRSARSSWPGLAGGLLRLHHPRPRWPGCAGGCPSRAGARPTGPTSPAATRWSLRRRLGRSSPTACGSSCATWCRGCGATWASS